MKRSPAFLILFIGFAIPSFACPLCNKQIQQGIYNSLFYPNKRYAPMLSKESAVSRSVLGKNNA